MAQKDTQQLADDLNSLLGNSATLKGALGTPKQRDRIEASTSRAYDTGSDSPGSSGGIDSPLTEQDGVRIYHAERYMYSTDGLFTIAYAPIASTKFNDLLNREITINYDDPDE